MLDFVSDEMRRNPFPVYDHMRREMPVFHEPRADAWMVFDYDGVKRALGDHEVFSSSMFSAGRRNPPWLIFFDPPRQTKLRALISRAFTSRMISNLEPRIAKLSRRLLDQAAEKGEMDLAADFAVPLPMLVIAGMIGIPTADWARLREWSDTILRLSYTLSESDEASRASEDYTRVTAEMAAYLRELTAERQRDPQDDLLTKLVQAEVDGERLSADEILGFFQILLVAGNETTTNLINNAVLCFLEKPEALAEVRRDRALLPAAIEEVLRYRSPVQWLFRATLQPVELNGLTIPAHKLVLPIVGSANRDARHFSDPDQFDIHRAPNPHIAFGHGLHFCLGAPLSRLEARIALNDVLDRLSEVELASDTPWEPRQALHVHGPARLPIRFVAARHKEAEDQTLR